MSGPVLAIPYRVTATETVVEAGKSVTRTNQVTRELTLAPETVELSTEMPHQLRHRSIYQAVLYEAKVSGKARFAFPPDLARTGIDPAQMDLARAELRFGLSDPRGLGANPKVVVGGRSLRLQPGGGSSGGRGFFAWVDATSLPTQPLAVEFAYGFRSNASLALEPDAGETRWQVRSDWPHPSFGGGFIPGTRSIGPDGFKASYVIGNLSLGRALVSTADAGTATNVPPASRDGRRIMEPAGGEGTQLAQIDLIQPVDLYSQVNRAVKYGFLFIGFTFLAFLLFDVIGGVKVSAVEYLLVGAALVLFFVLLLAFAEVIGFTAAYVVASAGIIGLNTAYSAAVLKSWRRASLIGVLLLGLYIVLYVLLSLEAFSLLIGSLMLFVALAAVMYLTRNLNWGGWPAEESAVAS